MSSSFLLRFQKSRSNSAEGVLLATGTTTVTNIRTEQADSDPHSCSFDAMTSHMSQSQDSNSRVLAGTKTITEVPQESADNDPTKRQFDSLPKV